MCNCKEKKEPATRKKPSITPIEVQPVSTNLTLQEVMIIENMLSEINTNQSKRSVISEFAFNHLGERLVNYCDRICQSRLRDKINKLKESLK